MRATIFTLAFLMTGIGLHAQFSADLITPFERDDNYSATYTEVIDHYESLAEAFPEQCRLFDFGMTDSGWPLSILLMSADGLFNPTEARDSGKTILLINNGIHAGEPCGVDASMMLARDLLAREDGLKSYPDVLVAIIPVYNIGGALNRNSTTRANQNGPREYGFRGNARNLDLNRDFIKCDSENAKSLNQLFTLLRPQLFIDTHTSNGADYQHVMTLIASQKDKLAKPLGDLQQNRLLPALYQGMTDRGWDMTPYVYARQSPDKGIYGFLDMPRYSSGYAALHHCLGFIAETHMFKPFSQRVRSTYDLLWEMVELAQNEGPGIRNARKEAVDHTIAAKTLPLSWKLDPDRVDSISFKGYEAGFKASEITGQDRLYYDREKPYTRTTPYFQNYKPTQEVDVPEAYLLPQAYQEVAMRMSWNGVLVEQLERDTALALPMYYIRDYKTVNAPYEGHYLHSQVEVEEKVVERRWFAGDFIIRTGQPACRYIVETLEPQAPDSYFAWNFFDGILMQKEYFSAYVFEDKAAELLHNDKELAAAFEAAKAADPELAKDGRAQLDWIYKRSAHYEPTHRLYPAARIKGPVEGLLPR